MTTTIHEQEFPFEEYRDEAGDFFISAEEAAHHTGLDMFHIWSVVECDGVFCYGPAHHYVNVLGFIATQEAHDGDTYYKEPYALD